MQEAATPPAKSEHEIRLEELAALAHAAKLSAIELQTIWSFDDLKTVLGIPASTFEVLIRKHPVEGAFLAGRRRMVMADVGRAWIASLAQANPYEQARPYNRREAA